MNKVFKACIALAAFAAFVVLPASASATNDPSVIETVNGSKVTLTPTHASPINIIGTSTTTLLTMTDADTNVLTQCETAEMTGNLETNTGTGENTVVEGTITTAHFRNHATAECSSTFGGITVETTSSVIHNEQEGGLPWCLRSTGTMNTDEFQVRGNSCTSASRPIIFVLNSTTIGKCTYRKTTPIVGTYTTHPSAAVMTIDHQEFPKVTGSFLCPSAGYLDMSFQLYRETAGGTEDTLYIENQ